MKQTVQIDFIDNTSTMEAISYTLRLQWHIIKNTIKVINKIAHRFPWVLIILVLAISTTVSLINIGKARAERDYYDHKLVKVEQQLNSYRAIIEGREEEK